jgi:hypothetical protein
LQPSGPAAPAPAAPAAGAEESTTAAKPAQPADRFAATPPAESAKPKPKTSGDRFGDARTFAEGLSAQKVSNRLAAAPASERGKLAAELLGSGELAPDQMADYVAGSETGKKGASTALSRAAALLGSSSDAGLQAAVASGLDRLLPPENADPASVQKFEKQLQAFFGSDRVSEKDKAGLVEAMRHSTNPTVRSAVALKFSQHINGLSQQLKDAQGRLGGMMPGGPMGSQPTEQSQKEYAQDQARIAELSSKVSASQAALGKLLTGPEGAPPPTFADPNRPQTPLGDLTNYIESNHNKVQVQSVKEVIRALFDPPSDVAAQSVATLADATLEFRHCPASISSALSGIRDHLIRGVDLHGIRILVRKLLILRDHESAPVPSEWRNSRRVACSVPPDWEQAWRGKRLDIAGNGSSTQRGDGRGKSAI